MALWAFFYGKMKGTADLQLAGPAVQRILALAEAVVVEAVTTVKAFEVRESLQGYFDGLAKRVGSFDGWKCLE